MSALLTSSSGGIAEEISLDKLLTEMIGAVKGMLSDPRAGIQENRALRVMLRRYARKYEIGRGTTSFIQSSQQQQREEDEQQREDREENDRRERVEELYGKKRQSTTTQQGGSKITFLDKNSSATGNNFPLSSMSSVFDGDGHRSSKSRRRLRGKRGIRKSGGGGGLSSSDYSDSGTTSDTESGLDAELAEDERYRLVDPGLQRIALVGDGEASMYFEQLQILRVAFLSPSFGRFSEEATKQRGEQILRGVPRHLFLDFFAPLLTRTNERGPNHSIASMLDVDNCGIIPWTALVKVLVNRGKLSDASREPYSIGAPSRSHHKAMISSICIPGVAVSKGRSTSAWNFNQQSGKIDTANADERRSAWSRLPPSLSNVFFTGGLDGIVREWQYDLAPTGGFYPGCEVATCSTIVHHRSCHNYYANSDTSVSMRNSPYSINDMTYLQSSKLLIAQSFGHLYNYQIKNTEDLVGRRVLHSVMRTENFHARPVKTDNWGEPTYAGKDNTFSQHAASLRGFAHTPIEGSGFRRVVISEKQPRAPPEEASASYCVVPGENPVPAPIITLKEAKGDIVALCGLLHLPSHSRSSLYDSFVMGTNEGEVLLYSLAKGTEGRGFLEPQWKWNMLQGGLVFSISEVPTSDSLMIIGNDQKGANFLDVVDVEKQMTKFRFLGGALCSSVLRNAAVTPGGSAINNRSAIETLLDSRLPPGYRSKKHRRQVLSEHAVLDVDDFGSSYTQADYDADRGLIIASGMGKKAALFSDSIPEPIHILDDHNDRIVGCTFNLARYRMLVMTADKTLHIYDSRMNRKIQTDTDFTLRSPVDGYSIAAFDKNNQLAIGAASTPVLFTPSIRADNNNTSSQQQQNSKNEAASSSSASILKGVVAGSAAQNQQHKNAVLGKNSGRRPGSPQSRRVRSTSARPRDSGANNQLTTGGGDGEDSEQTKLSAVVSCSSASYLAICMGNVAGSIRVLPTNATTSTTSSSSHHHHSPLLTRTSTNISSSLVTVAKEPQMIYSAQSISDRCSHIAIDPIGGRRLAVCINSTSVYLINCFTGTVMFRITMGENLFASRSTNNNNNNKNENKKATTTNQTTKNNNNNENNSNSTNNEEVSCLVLTEAAILGTGAHGVRTSSPTTSPTRRSASASASSGTGDNNNNNDSKSTTTKSRERNSKRSIICVGGTQGQLIVALCDPPMTLNAEGVPVTPENEFDPQMQIAGAEPPSVPPRSVVCFRRLVRPAGGNSSTSTNNSSSLALHDPVYLDITKGIRSSAIISITGGGDARGHGSSLFVSTAAGDVFLLNFGGDSGSSSSSSKTSSSSRLAATSFQNMRRIVSYDTILSNFPLYLRENYTQIAEEQSKLAETYASKYSSPNHNQQQHVSPDTRAVFDHLFDRGQQSSSSSPTTKNNNNNIQQHQDGITTTTTSSSLLSQQSKMITNSAPFRQFLREQHEENEKKKKQNTLEHHHQEHHQETGKTKEKETSSSVKRGGIMTATSSSSIVVNNNNNNINSQSQSLYDDIFTIDEAERKRLLAQKNKIKLSDDILAAKTPAVYSLWLQATVLAARQVESVVVLDPHPYLAVLFGDGTVSISFLSRRRVLPQVSFKAIRSPSSSTENNGANNTENNSNSSSHQVFGRSMLFYAKENLLVIGDSCGGLSFFDLSKFWIASKASLEGKEQQSFLSPASRAILSLRASSSVSPIGGRSRPLSAGSRQSPQNSNNLAFSLVDNDEEGHSSSSPSRTESRNEDNNNNNNNNNALNTEESSLTSPLSPRTPSALAQTMRQDTNNKNFESSSSMSKSVSASVRGKLFGGGAAPCSSIMGRSAMVDIEKKQKEDEARKHKEQAAEEAAEKERKRIADEKRKQQEEAEKEFDDSFPVRFLGTFTIAKDASINSLELYKDSLCIVHMMSHSAVLVVDLDRIVKLGSQMYKLLRKFRYQSMLLSSSSSSPRDRSHERNDNNNDGENDEEKSQLDVVKRQISRLSSFVRVSLVLGDVSLFSIDEQSILRSSLGLRTDKQLGLGTRSNTTSLLGGDDIFNNNNDGDDQLLTEHEQALASQALSERTGKELPGTRRKSLQTATNPMQTMYSGHSNENPETRMSMKSAQQFKTQLRREISQPDRESAQTLGGKLGADIEHVTASDISMFTSNTAQDGTNSSSGLVGSGDFEAALIKQREEREKEQNINTNDGSKTSRKEERRRTQVFESQQPGMPSPSWDLVFISGQEFLLAMDHHHHHDKHNQHGNENDDDDDEQDFDYASTYQKQQQQQQQQQRCNHPFFSHRSYGGEACFEDLVLHNNNNRQEQQPQQNFEHDNNNTNKFGSMMNMTTTSSLGLSRTNMMMSINNAVSPPPQQQQEEQLQHTHVKKKNVAFDLHRDDEENTVQYPQQQQQQQTSFSSSFIDLGDGATEDALDSTVHIADGDNTEEDKQQQRHEPDFTSTGDLRSPQKSTEQRQQETQSIFQKQIQQQQQQQVSSTRSSARSSAPSTPQPPSTGTSSPSRTSPTQQNPEEEKKKNNDTKIRFIDNSNKTFKNKSSKDSLSFLDDADDDHHLSQTRNKSGNSDNVKSLSFYSPSSTLRKAPSSNLMLLTTKTSSSLANTARSLAATGNNNNNNSTLSNFESAFQQGTLTSSAQTLLFSNTSQNKRRSSSATTARHAVKYPQSTYDGQKMNKVPLRNSGVPAFRDLDYHRVEMDEDQAIPGTLNEKNPFTELVKANSMKRLEFQRRAKARLLRGHAVLDADVKKKKQAEDRDRRHSFDTATAEKEKQHQSKSTTRKTTTTTGIPLRLSTPDPHDDEVAPIDDANTRARDDLSRFFQLAPGGDNDGDTEPAPSRFAFTPATPPPPSMLGEHITVQSNNHHEKMMIRQQQQQQQAHQRSTTTTLSQLHHEEQEELHRHHSENYHGRKFPVTREEIMEELNASDLDEEAIKHRLNRLYTSNRGFTPDRGGRKVNADGIVTTSGDTAEEVAMRLLHVFGPAPSRPKSSPSKSDFYQTIERGGDLSSARDVFGSASASAIRSASNSKKKEQQSTTSQNTSSRLVPKRPATSRPSTANTTTINSSTGHHHFRQVRQRPTSDKEVTNPPKILYPYHMTAKYHGDDVRQYHGAPPSFLEKKSSDQENNNNPLRNSSPGSKISPQRLRRCSPPGKRQMTAGAEQIALMKTTTPIFVESRYQPRIGTQEWRERTNVLNEAVEKATESQIKVSRALRRRQIVKQAHQQSSSTPSSNKNSGDKNNSSSDQQTEQQQSPRAAFSGAEGLSGGFVFRSLERVKFDDKVEKPNMPPVRFVPDEPIMRYRQMHEKKE